MVWYCFLSLANIIFLHMVINGLNENKIMSIRGIFPGFENIPAYYSYKVQFLQFWKILVTPLYWIWNKIFLVCLPT